MSDYLMLGLLLICMRYDEKVYYKVLDNTQTTKMPQTEIELLLTFKYPIERRIMPSH